jgi:lipoprotein-releasing system permease protein
VAMCFWIKNNSIIKLASDVYYIDYLPVEIKMQDIVVIVCAALALSFLSTLYPAYKASKLDPVEAIRNE